MLFNNGQAVPGVAPAPAASPAAIAAGQGQPATAPKTDPYALRLSKPIQTHQGSTSTIKFRDPIGSDFVDVNKLPFEVVGVDGARTVKIDFALGAKWASRLSGIDEELLGQMNRADFFAMLAKVNDILISDGADAKN